MKLKKLVYKLISENKGSNNKVMVDKLFRKHQEEVQKSGAKRDVPVIQSKEQLVQVLIELERDNLIMYSPEDGGEVILV